MQASFLRASLYTSIVAFGIAAMAAAMGVLFVLIGLGMRDVSRHVQAAPQALDSDQPPAATSSPD